MVHLVLSEKIRYWLTSSVVMWCNIYNMSHSHTSKQACLLFHFSAKCWFQGGQGSFRSLHGKPLCQNHEVILFMHWWKLQHCFQVLSPQFKKKKKKKGIFFPYKLGIIKALSRKKDGLLISWMIYGSVAVMKASWYFSITFLCYIKCLPDSITFKTNKIKIMCVCVWLYIYMFVFTGIYSPIAIQE